MKKLSKYSDTIFLLMIACGFIIGGIIAVLSWRVSSEGWRTNFEEYSVDPEAFTDGGVGRDFRIVPIDNPRFVTITEASVWLDKRTPVIAVLLYQEARAYPLTLLVRHEIVNDEIGDMPIAVTYCPLCNSPIVYERLVDDNILRFGISGNLYGNNFVMYDDLTESWWHQFTGEAIVGDFTGTTLTIVQSQVVGFASFAEHYPDGMVLAGDSNSSSAKRAYTMNPYLHYDESSSPLMNNGEYDRRLDPLERVLATVINDTPIAYSFTYLKAKGVVNDVVSEYPIVALWQPGVASALDGMTIEDSRDVGQAVLFGRELDGHILTFRYVDGRIFDNETNSEWNIFGEAIEGELKGKQLPHLTCFSYFWFAWSESYPNTLLNEG